MYETIRAVAALAGALLLFKLRPWRWFRPRGLGVVLLAAGLSVAMVAETGTADAAMVAPMSADSTLTTGPGVSCVRSFGDSFDGGSFPEETPLPLHFRCYYDVGSGVYPDPYDGATGAIALGEEVTVYHTSSSATVFDVVADEASCTTGYCLWDGDISNEDLGSGTGLATLSATTMAALGESKVFGPNEGRGFRTDLGGSDAWFLSHSPPAGCEGEPFASEAEILGDLYPPCRFGPAVEVEMTGCPGLDFEWPAGTDDPGDLPWSWTNEHELSVTWAEGEGPSQLFLRWRDSRYAMPAWEDGAWFNTWDGAAGVGTATRVYTPTGFVPVTQAWYGETGVPPQNWQAGTSLTLPVNLLPLSDPIRTDDLLVLCVFDSGSGTEWGITGPATGFTSGGDVPASRACATLWVQRYQPGVDVGWTTGVASDEMVLSINRRGVSQLPEPVDVEYYDTDTAAWVLAVDSDDMSDPAYDPHHVVHAPDPWEGLEVRCVDSDGTYTDGTVGEHVPSMDSDGNLDPIPGEQGCYSGTGIGVSPASWVPGLARMGGCVLKTLLIPSPDTTDGLFDAAEVATTKAPISYATETASFVTTSMTGIPPAASAASGDELVFVAADGAWGEEVSVGGGDVPDGWSTVRTSLGVVAWAAWALAVWGMTLGLLRR